MNDVMNFLKCVNIANTLAKVRFGKFVSLYERLVAITDTIEVFCYDTHKK